MQPFLETQLAQRNKEIHDSHARDFPYGEFTFALITLVLADLPMEKMEAFSLYHKNTGIKFTSWAFDLMYDFCLDISAMPQRH